MFIYHKGVASTAVGDFCVLDQYAGTSTRAVAASKGPGGVAMSANVANQYGWYCVRGAVPVKAATVVAGTIPFVTATDGTLDDTAAAGQGISGAKFATADGTPSAGLAVILLRYPSVGILDGT